MQLQTCYKGRTRISPSVSVAAETKDVLLLLLLSTEYKRDKEKRRGEKGKFVGSDPEKEDTASGHEE